MIDLREARERPEELRAALARKGAGELFDELLAADAAVRELQPRVEDLRAAQSALATVELGAVRLPFAELVHRIRHAGITVSDRRAAMPSTVATTPASSLRRVLRLGSRLTVRLTAL